VTSQQKQLQSVEVRLPVPFSSFFIWLGGKMVGFVIRHDYVESVFFVSNVGDVSDTLDIDRATDFGVFVIVVVKRQLMTAQFKPPAKQAINNAQ